MSYDRKQYFCHHYFKLMSNGYVLLFISFYSFKASCGNTNFSKKLTYVV